MGKAKNRLYYAAKAAGVCPWCNAKPAAGHTFCPDCLEKQRLKYYAAKAEKKKEQARLAKLAAPTPPPKPEPAPAVVHLPEPEPPQQTPPARSVMEVTRPTNPQTKAAPKKYLYSRKVDLKDSMRKCHDCGKPTYNFRCDKCRAKFKRDYGE